jgi:hypothetical protein
VPSLPRSSEDPNTCRTTALATGLDCTRHITSRRFTSSPSSHCVALPNYPLWDQVRPSAAALARRAGPVLAPLRAAGPPAPRARQNARYQEHSQATAWRIAAPRFLRRSSIVKRLSAPLRGPARQRPRCWCWCGVAQLLGVDVVPTPAGQIRVQMRYLIIAAASRSSGADSEPIGFDRGGVRKRQPVVRSVQQISRSPSERATDLDVRTRDGGVDDRPTDRLARTGLLPERRPGMLIGALKRGRSHEGSVRLGATCSSDGVDLSGGGDGSLLPKHGNLAPPILISDSCTGQMAPPDHPGDCLHTTAYTRRMVQNLE